MFSKLFGCCAKGTYNAELYEIEDRLKYGTASTTDSPDNVSTNTTPKKKRSGLLHRLRHRRTKEEEILHYEKRYLKKFLQHYAMYVSGMSVEQMRMARQLVGRSMLGETAAPAVSLSSSESQDKVEGNFCAYCCHCFGCAGRGAGAKNGRVSNTAPKQGICEPEMGEMAVEGKDGKEPGGIVAEAKRVVDKIRKENALKQMGPPPEKVVDDLGHEKATVKEGTEKTELKPAENEEPKLLLASNEEVGHMNEAPDGETTKPEVKLAETEEGDCNSEPESSEDGELLSFIRQGLYTAFDQPGSDFEDWEEFL